MSRAPASAGLSLQGPHTRGIVSRKPARFRGRGRRSASSRRRVFRPFVLRGRRGDVERFHGKRLAGAMTGGEVLVASLRREGVEAVFGLPGVQIYGVMAALRGEPGIRFIATRHEQATTYMADGYARAGGRPGTALVVPGPGLLNAASGLATAYACSSPVLLIAGQVPRSFIDKGVGQVHEVSRQLDALRVADQVAKARARRLRDPGSHPVGFSRASKRPAAARRDRDAARSHGRGRLRGAPRSASDRARRSERFAISTGPPTSSTHRRIP